MAPRLGATSFERFNEAFWMEDEKYFAGRSTPTSARCAPIVSNPGHGLYCGIVDDDKAAQVAKRLLAPDMFSGWGDPHDEQAPRRTTR